jgi:hypothetical protein
MWPASNCPRAPIAALVGRGSRGAMRCSPGAPLIPYRLPVFTPCCPTCLSTRFGIYAGSMRQIPRETAKRKQDTVMPLFAIPHSSADRDSSWGWIVRNSDETATGVDVSLHRSTTVELASAVLFHRSSATGIERPTADRAPSVAWRVSILSAHDIIGGTCEGQENAGASMLRAARRVPTLPGCCCPSE